jgi:hypothetical protein
MNSTSSSDAVVPFSLAFSKKAFLSSVSTRKLIALPPLACSLTLNIPQPSTLPILCLSGFWGEQAIAYKFLV